jgi:hypothetical protein
MSFIQPTRQNFNVAPGVHNFNPVPTHTECGWPIIRVSEQVLAQLSQRRLADLVERDRLDAAMFSRREQRRQMRALFIS